MTQATNKLTFSILLGAALTPAMRSEITRLCSDAYEEDFAPVLAEFPAPVHVLARSGERLVSHALWVERQLQVGDGAFLRTAYIEAVATDPLVQRRGYASAVMRYLADQLAGFELAALAPFDVKYYARLGWERWQGPLAIRTADGLLPTPDEEVMILRLPATPPLDLRASLSAEWRVGEVW